MHTHWIDRVATCHRRQSALSRREDRRRNKRAPRERENETSGALRRVQIITNTSRPSHWNYKERTRARASGEKKKDTYDNSTRLHGVAPSSALHDRYTNCDSRLNFSAHAPTNQRSARRRSRTGFCAGAPLPAAQYVPYFTLFESAILRAIFSARTLRLECLLTSRNAYFIYLFQISYI